jgi:hypothetical protein
MDVGGRPCEPRQAVWFRVVLVLAVASLVAGIAHAQAPPASFFEGRSNDELRALASNPQNDVLLRRSAATKLVMTLADAGDFDAADAAGREFAKNIDPLAIKHASAVRRRRYVHGIALGALAGALATAVLCAALANRVLERALGAVRRAAPVIALFFVYAGLVGGYLASGYENSSPLPFLWFAALMLPVVVIFRAWSAVGSPRPAARLGRGVFAVAAALALGFLVVERINPIYLEGFGL